MSNQTKAQEAINIKLGTHTFRYFQNFRFSDMKNGMFQGRSHILLYFLKYFGDKYGVRGPYLVEVLEISEVIQKILQYVWESNLAILE